MITPFAGQIALVLLAMFSVGGVLVAVFYPKLAGGTKGEKRLEAIEARLATAGGARA